MVWELNFLHSKENYKFGLGVKGLKHAYLSVEDTKWLMVGGVLNIRSKDLYPGSSSATGFFFCSGVIKNYTTFTNDRFRLFLSIVPKYGQKLNYSHHFVSLATQR